MHIRHLKGSLSLLWHLGTTLWTQHFEGEAGYAGGSMGVGVKNKADFGEKLRSSRVWMFFLEMGALWVGENGTSAGYSCIFVPCAFSGYTGPSGHSKAYLSHLLGLLDTPWPPFPLTLY